MLERTDSAPDEAEHERGIAGELRRDLEFEARRHEAEEDDVDALDYVLAVFCFFVRKGRRDCSSAAKGKGKGR